MPSSKKSHYKKSVGQTSSGEELWLVDQVLDDRRNESGIVQYLVQWSGWPKSYNSWEPAENLGICKESLQVYLERKHIKLMKGDSSISSPSKCFKFKSPCTSSTPCNQYTSTYIESEKFGSDTTPERNPKLQLGVRRMQLRRNCESQ
ncbi:hypothetical protein F5879DRAFT_940073 [Lentinula edodes]|nr:hypothetical protein F5879DRAFT_940073 [Lentinula edodes]